MSTETSTQLPENAEIVIVGAGVAGLYCAWRLLQQNPYRSVVVLERLNRTGGRLDSDLINIESVDGTVVTVREEEGGMRFTYKMEELMSLLCALELCDQTVYFPMDTNRYYLRGHSFTHCEAEADGNRIWGQLYDLDPAEQNQSPGALLNVIYERILKVNGVESPPKNPTPEFWQNFRLEFCWKGIPLNEWQLWGLIRDMGYSEECIKMFTDVVGFEGPFLSLASAGEAWQILEDFPANPHYYTLKDGFSTVTGALRDRIDARENRIYLGTNVESIHKTDDGFEVRVGIAPEGESAYPFEPGIETSTITCQKVILATAAKAMDMLFITSPVLHQADNARQIYEDIQSVQKMRLMKINLYFEEPWWQNGLTGQEPVIAGPSFTDLPINAVYPFYPVSGISADNPAALTLYCDFNNTNFWQGLQNVGHKFESRLQHKHSKKPQVLFPASQAVVDEALKQLKALFDTHWIPDPVLTSYRLWSGELDFEYAYHQWAINVNDADVTCRMVQPNPAVELYTCNESYSDMQGWVNGSLRSADLVMKQFDLKKFTEEYHQCQEPKAPAEPKCVDGRYVYPKS